MIGKYYDVLCARAIWLDSQSKPRWWPVTGPQHEDGEIIGFPHQHYHVDYRFLRADERRLTIGRAAHPVFVVPIAMVSPDVPERPTPTEWGISLETLPQEHYPVESYLRVMRRRQNADALEHPGEELARWMDDLKAAYADAELLGPPERPVCPHRLAPLDNLPVDDESCVTCPLHGLRWNLETRRMEPKRPIGGDAGFRP